MGHLIFLVIHGIAIFCMGCWPLILTIPLHLIYSAMGSKKS